MQDRKCNCDVEKGSDDDVATKQTFAVKTGWQSAQADRPIELNWMGLLSDEAPLSSLTIPGTHDSAAFTSSVPFIATQKMNIRAQLNAGIRYFDLRCAIRDDVVEMVHGISYLGITLEHILHTMYTWLANHPTEALLVQIKKDRDRQRSSMHMSQAVFSIIARKPNRWRTENTTPLLGELRGRIQLIRRFVDEDLNFFGMDVTGWQDNQSEPFTLFKNTFRVTIQDHYNFSDPESLPSLVSKKGGNVSELMARACSDSNPDHWYINFTSAYELNLYYQIAPRQIAVGGWHRFHWEDGMNVRLRGTLGEMGRKKRRFGIVAMDFPELGCDDLIPALIQFNFDLEEPRSRIVSTICIALLMCFVLLWIDIWTGGSLRS